jgi:trans-aconitate methyltransferase
LTPLQPDDPGLRVAKYPRNRGPWTKPGESVLIQQAPLLCHPEIMPKISLDLNSFFPCMKRSYATQLSKSTHSLSRRANVKDYYQTLGSREIKQARVLDFGCGWGRIIRYFAKDVPNDALLGCDPCDEILQTCQSLRVPGTFRVSDFRPRELPFGEKFDLVYAYSVFTHLAEQTHQECLETLHNAMAKDGVLIVTFRSREFIDIRGGDLKKVSRKEINQLYDTYDRGEYAFQPHFREPIQGEITYGDTIIPQEYIQKKWTKLFTIVGVGFPQKNSYQIPLLMKKR